MAPSKMDGLEFISKHLTTTTGGNGDPVREEGQTQITREIAIDEDHCCECDSLGILKGPVGYQYKLSGVFTTARLQQHLTLLRMKTVCVMVLAWVGSALAGWFISKRLVKRIEAAAATVGKMSLSDGMQRRIAISGDDEIAQLSRQINVMADALNQEVAAIVEKEKAASMMTIARQVAHDVRSPLAALAMVSQELGDLPEDLRVLVRTAIERIQGIANNLLHGDGGAKKEPDNCQLVTHIENVVSEKRMQFKKYPKLRLDFLMRGEHYVCSALIDATDFQRIMSNLLNNAVEAVDGEGTVVVEMLERCGRTILRIRDDGRGMPEEMIRRLGEPDLRRASRMGRELAFTTPS